MISRYWFALSQAESHGCKKKKTERSTGGNARRYAGPGDRIGHRLKKNFVAMRRVQNLSITVVQVPTAGYLSLIPPTRSGSAGRSTFER